MATAYLLDPFEPARSGSMTPLQAEHFLPYAREIEREHPEHLSAMGLGAEEYAASMAAPGLTIDESVHAGLLSGAEGRFIKGIASRDDLRELGYSPAEIEGIFAEQQVRACASSR